MNDTDKFVTFLKPLLLHILRSEESLTKDQIVLDNKDKESIHCVQEVSRDD